jgi:hypothetical protein
MLIDIDIYGNINTYSLVDILEGKEAFSNGLIAFIVRKFGDILYDPTIPSHNAVLFKLQKPDVLQKFGERLYDELERFFGNYMYIENFIVEGRPNSTIGVQIEYTLIDTYTITGKVDELQKTKTLSFEIKMPTTDPTKYEEVKYDKDNITEFLDSIAPYTQKIHVVDNEVFIDDKKIIGLKPFSKEYIEIVSYLQMLNPKISVQIGG